MKILAVDTSSMMGSVALIDDDKIIAEQLLNIRITHSERFISSIETILESAETDIKSIDGFGVAIGPGSFTGLRIGLAAVKGFAFTLDKPVVGVSTLRALALNAGISGFPVAALLDARRGEYYLGIYQFENDKIIARLEDKVLPPDQVIKEVQALKEKVIFVGDGLYSLKGLIKEKLKGRALIPPPSIIHPRASNIAWLALKRLEKNDSDDIDKLVPNYIRKSDAEKG